MSYDIWSINCAGIALSLITSTLLNLRLLLEFEYTFGSKLSQYVAKNEDSL
jgi:hypothetical protein